MFDIDLAGGRPGLSVIIQREQQRRPLGRIVGKRNVQQDDLRAMLAIAVEIDAALVVDRQESRTFAIDDIGRLAARRPKCEGRVAGADPPFATAAGSS